ncbi:hypothetical protein PybrP1_002218 [[Pythium] brassicae (nom. inval.)]|nr:hypothetical protein PybrP1_002218 [[Pythium] brassicae (nom. inval.)]
MADDVVAEYERLTDEQRALEQEIAAIAEELTSGANPAGLSGALVDADGFPRGDVDVYRVRHQRHAFAVKQNDHRAVMRRIEELLPQVFAAKAAAKRAEQGTQRDDASATGAGKSAQTSRVAAPAATAQASAATAATVTEIDAAERAKTPFAVVQSVQAGLHAADQVLAFGTADAGNHRNLEAVKEIVMRNIGSPIRVVVRRGAGSADAPWTFRELLLTPQQWLGAGVLGCLLMPIQDSV